MAFDPQFKKALQMLPDAEKDKLILRMLRLNVDLAKKLHFELVDTDTVDEKREEVQKKITKDIQSFSKNFYSAGCLLMDVRSVSGAITEHVNITKDKFGEISLNCLMLRLVLQLNNKHIVSELYGQTYTLCMYIIARIFKILMLIQKQHEDLHLEFKEDIVSIGKLVTKNEHLMEMAWGNGLEVEWLTRFEIPEDIADIHKTLRKNGLLR